MSVWTMLYAHHPCSKVTRKAIVAFVCHAAVAGAADLRTPLIEQPNAWKAGKIQFSRLFRAAGAQQEPLVARMSKFSELLTVHLQAWRESYAMRWRKGDEKYSYSGVNMHRTRVARSCLVLGDTIRSALFNAKQARMCCRSEAVPQQRFDH